MQKFTLKESKGVVLPVLILLMKVNRPVSVTYLVDEIDSSDKTICKALRFLQKKEAVTQIGRLYQYCGDEYQLPLYWGERIEPADPSPASYQAELPGIGRQAEKFSGKIPESGKFPVIKRSTNDIIRDHEARIRALEAELAALKSGEIPERIEQKTSTFVQKSNENSENFPETGEIPTFYGEFSDDDNNPSLLSSTTVIDIKDDHNDAGKFPNSGKIPEISRDEYISLINDIDRYYGSLDYGIPAYPEYAAVKPYDDEAQEFIDDLVRLQPSKKAVEFFIPRTKNFDNLIEWLSLNHFEAKKKLLEYYGFGGKMMVDILKDKSITLSQIDYHYQYWKLHEKDLPKWTLGTVGSRILQKYDLLSANTSDPLKINCLDEYEEA